jgi:hypothetical protein
MFCKIFLLSKLIPYQVDKESDFYEFSTSIRQSILTQLESQFLTCLHHFHLITSVISSYHTRVYATCAIYIVNGILDCQQKLKKKTSNQALEATTCGAMCKKNHT